MHLLAAGRCSEEYAQCTHHPGEPDGKCLICTIGRSKTANYDLVLSGVGLRAIQAEARLVGRLPSIIL